MNFKSTAFFIGFISFMPFAQADHYEFREVITPGAESKLKTVEVQAQSFEGDAKDVEAELSQIELSADDVTTIIPDSPDAVASSYLPLAQRISMKAKGAYVHDFATASVKQFSDWFSKNKLRLSIVTFEITTMSGLKFTEMMISPQPIEHIPALTAAILMGGILGSIEWNTTSLIHFITTQGTFVKQMIDRISIRDEAVPGRDDSKTRDVLTTTWQYFKNTGINFVLFGAFKIIVYAAVNSHGDALDRAVDAFSSMTSPDVGTWAVLALEATSVSFPTTKLIIKNHQKEMQHAGGDAIKLRGIRDKTTLFMSSALTARAVLFSSIMVSKTLGWPALEVAAYSGLGLMFGGSILKLWSDSQKTQLRSCNKVLLFP